MKLTCIGVEEVGNVERWVWKLMSMRLFGFQLRVLESWWWQRVVRKVFIASEPPSIVVTVHLGS